MKRIVLSAVVLMFLFSATGCSSEHYVAEQPEAVVVTRPAPPASHYVWVDGEYYWRGDSYAYRPGYWVAPKPGRVWVAGTWVRTPKGYYWREGHWR